MSQIVHDFCAGNTSNLKSHLRVHHAVEYAALKNYELADKKARMSNESKPICDKHVAKPTVFKQTHLQLGAPQTQSQTVSRFDRNHPKQQLITQKIAEMICKDLQPYSIVEDIGFRAVLTAAEPRYVMPSRKTFSADIIPKLYDDMITNVKSEVQGAVSLAFTTDGWTSRANNSYLSYTAHFITPSFELRNFCLNVEHLDESHTAACLAQSLVELTNNWTTESQRENSLKIAVVSDNAANIQAAIAQVPMCHSVRCFDHTLQLAIADAVKNCAELQSTIQKAKAITTHFKHSSQNTKKLLDRQKLLGLPQLKLKQECVTRWNSTYEMLARLVTVKDAVASVVATIKKVKGFSANEWEIAEEYVKVFKPFTILTANMGSATIPTLSMIIPELNKLKHALVTDPSFEATCLPTLKEDLIAGIDNRWSGYESNRLYAVATLVDPRYKDCGFSEESSAAMARILVLNEMSSLANRHQTCLDNSSQPTASVPNSSGGQINMFTYIC
jgi:hypothetical protein